MPPIKLGANCWNQYADWPNMLAAGQRVGENSSHQLVLGIARRDRRCHGSGTEAEGGGRHRGGNETDAHAFLP